MLPEESDALRWNTKSLMPIDGRAERRPLPPFVVVLKGNPDVLARLDDAETLLRNLRRALTS